jgi:insulysin
MILIVFTNQELELMEEKITKLFSNIPNKNLGPIPYHKAEPAFTSNEFQRIRKIKTINKARQIRISFILPPQIKEFKSKSTSILSHLLGHEGKGSLLSYLIKEELALELSSFNYDETTYFSRFGVRIILTPKGFEEYERVVKYVFCYLKMIKINGLPQYIFDEIKNIKNMKYKFRSQSSGIRKIQEFARILPYYPAEFVNRIYFLMEEYQPEKFISLLDYFVPSRMFIELSNHQFEDLPLRDKYYDTEYSNELISTPLIEEIQKILKGKFD